MATARQDPQADIRALEIELQQAKQKLAEAADAEAKAKALPKERDAALALAEGFRKALVEIVALQPWQPAKPVAQAALDAAK